MLLGVGAVGIVLTSMLFRWEGTDPIPRRSLATDRGGVCADARRGGACRAGVPDERAARARAASSRRRAAARCCVLRGATVLDGLGGRIVNARVVIRDHRIAEVSLDDERVPLPEGATVEDLARALPDSRPVRFARALGRLGRHRPSPDRARPTIGMAHDFGATLAAGVTSVVSLTDDLDDMRALVGRRGGGRTARAADVLRRAVGHRARRPSGARCSRSCPGSPSS